MRVDLSHDVLKADLAGAQSALGVIIQRHDQERESVAGAVCERTLSAELGKPCGIRARFVQEGLLERAKKLFHAEVEVGSTWFDDAVYVITSTREATEKLLQHRRVQQALILLVDASRQVEIEDDVVRVVDTNARDDGRDASAELLALVAHLCPPSP